MVDIDAILEKLRKFNLPTEHEIKQLCDKAREILESLDNVAELNCPITVCGNIHGQFEDLLEIFDIGGEVPETNYIFLGNFVDRGDYSVETIIFLLTLKIKYPHRITLLRGSHESRQISQNYGFYDECQKKYGNINVWRMCTDIFDLFQLCAVIESKIFCVHGGLSPLLNFIDDIRKIDRKQEVPENGLMCDILYSDPDEWVWTYVYQSRGAGYLFGEKDVYKFNRENNIDLIARSHEFIRKGYQFLFNEKIVTVWSAPNYFHKCDNDASIMEFDEHMNRNFKIFQACQENARNQPDKKPDPEYFIIKNDYIYSN